MVILNCHFHKINLCISSSTCWMHAGLRQYKPRTKWYLLHYFVSETAVVILISKKILKYLFKNCLSTSTQKSFSLQIHHWVFCLGNKKNNSAKPCWDKSGQFQMIDGTNEWTRGMRNKTSTKCLKNNAF